LRQDTYIFQYTQSVIQGQDMFFSILFATQQAYATTMVPLSLHQLVDAADEVVKGQVTEVWTEPDQKTGMVWTYAQIEVTKILKGDPGSIVILEQPGGKWGSKEASVEGVARFSVGEEGYFFVEHLDSGHNVSVGMSQGKFNIIMDPYQRKEIAVRFPVHIQNSFDHRFIPLPPPKQRTTTANFELSITNRVHQGWDGRAIPGTSSSRLEKISPKIEKNILNKEIK